jgi:hypothetical protein
LTLLPTLVLSFPYTFPKGKVLLICNPDFDWRRLLYFLNP